jgi:hypothetical protein
LWCAAILATISGALSPALAQDSAASLLASPARDWAVDCAANEALVILHPGSYLRYRLHIVDEKGDQLRDQIETPEGTVARLIERDGRALTAAEDSAERNRLKSLAASPATFTRRAQREQDNKKMGVSLLKLMPGAMLWSYAPGQPQPSNQPAGDASLVVLDFKPDPKWSPPNLESELLTGLEGRVWIDPRSRRMVRLEADVFRTVNIGWGLLARVYPGGTVTLQQTNAGGGRWAVDHIAEQHTLRELMIRSLKQRLTFDAAGFQPIPPVTYQQAIQMLLDPPPSSR